MKKPKLSPADAKARQLILESMSCIYHLYKERSDAVLDKDVSENLCKAYNHLQLCRDDIRFLNSLADINKGYLKKLKESRISEFTNPPFELSDTSWIS